MKIDVEKFLTMTALLATTTVGACSVTSTTKTINDGDGGAGGATATGGTSSGGSGTGGSGGGGTGGTASGGSGGTGATGGDAGSEGGTGGGGGDAGTEGGPDASSDATAPDGSTSPEAGACLGDVAPPWSPPDAGPGDAGTEGVDRCELLPYAQAWCQPDAGGEGHWMDGYGYCGAFQASMRPGVFDAFASCLEKLPVTDPCSPSHSQAVLGCFDAATARACGKPVPAVGDSGADVCDTVAAGCQEITAVKCREVLSGFSDTSVADAVACLAVPSTVDGGACASAFWACVPPYGLVR